MKMKSIIRVLWKRSPAENFAIAQARLTPRNDMPESRNDMLDPLMALSSFPVIAGWCLAKLPVTDIMLLGDARTIESWQIDKILTDKNICIRNWTWTDGLDTDYSGRIVICRAPYSPEHWDTIWKANKTAVHAVRVTTIGELIAPFLQVVALTKCFDYFVKSIDDIIPWYLGKNVKVGYADFFGPLKELDAIFPLAGKTVIEFGCLDGYQSLGLCHLKARLTCLDARAENVIKTRAALNAVGFDAPIFVDDFHNAHANKYGRFDLAFAHGVYYHSVAPFVFLENLVSLSDHIFLGGYCATDDLPVQGWEHIEYQRRVYRAKHYTERQHFTAGINKHSWYFHKDDLKRFFAERGFEITTISDEPQNDKAGNYSRFLASRQQS